MFLFLLFRNFHHNRGFAVQQFDQLDDSLFRRMFRVDRETFNYILNKLESFYPLNGTKAVNSSGAAVPLKTRLAVTLRWLAGGSYLDLRFAWGLGISTFYDSDHGILWRTLQVLDEIYRMGFPADDENKLEELSQGFSFHSNGILDGCVLALDGFGVSTRAPYESEVVRQKVYWFSKSGFAIIVLAGCDMNARFICASCIHSGSTNDIVAWQDTLLFQMLEVDKELPEKYFFIGDEAFNTTQQFLSPWPGRGLDIYKDSFNYWLSYSRQAIERAFGMLAQQFGIFWRIFRFSFDRWPLVVMVSMKLHNLCLDKSCSVPCQRYTEDVQPGDEWAVHDNIRENDPVLRVRAMGERRGQITANLEHMGILRPAHAQINSRC
jgi:hypothetical protein